MKANAHTNEINVLVYFYINKVEYLIVPDTAHFKYFSDLIDIMIFFCEQCFEKIHSTNWQKYVRAIAEIMENSVLIPS